MQFPSAIAFATRHILTAMAAAGLLLAAANGGLAWETDTSRTGASYSTIPLDDPGSAADRCAALCAKDAQCRAWTLVKEGNPDLGAGTFSLCLLKNAVPAAVFDECCISGVAAGVEATEPSQVNESDEAPVRPDAQSAATMPEGPVTVEMSPEVVPVGKWPEGIAHDGSGLWLAMSGERQLYRTDPETGEIVRRVKVGRLPVRLAAFGDGPVYATVATDKIIWAQPSEGKGRAIARLKDYPQSLATDGESVWALT